MNKTLRGLLSVLLVAVLAVGTVGMISGCKKKSDSGKLLDGISKKADEAAEKAEEVVDEAKKAAE